MMAVKKPLKRSILSLLVMVFLTGCMGEARAAGVILGFPTAGSISLKALAAGDQSMYIQYGTEIARLDKQTSARDYASGAVMEAILTGLQPNQQYYYKMLVKAKGNKEYGVADSGSFHTARAAGASFVFTIQADSHRDENCDVNLYSQTLQNIAADKPDFHFDLGDTFMGEKQARNQTEIAKRYLDDRSYFCIIGSSVPLFLVNGNHEGEVGWDSRSNGLKSWAVADRQLYFPIKPEGTFYTGNTRGQGNYYAFTWGDTLFVILDPFSFTTNKPRNDNEGWNYTLGRTQYDWLKKTLAGSKALYKFVLVHNLVGGYSKDARGGAEASRFFEWGGANLDGSYGFDSKRPGWGKPIHQLLVDNGVTAVFHGHDHFYARQTRDSIVYQLVPQPGHPGTSINQAAQYSYINGDFLPPAGHIRVEVSPSLVQISYISSSLNAGRNWVVALSYKINAK